MIYHFLRKGTSYSYLYTSNQLLKCHLLNSLALRTCGRFLQMSHVAWSGMTPNDKHGVRHTGEPCKNGWTNHNAILGLTCMGSRNHVATWGSRSLHGRTNFCKLFGPLKSVVFAVIYAAKEIIQSPQWHSMQCGLSSKFCDHLLLNGVTSVATLLPWQPFSLWCH